MMRAFANRGKAPRIAILHMLLALCAFFIQAASTRAEQPVKTADDWRGAYVYEYDGGKTAGGSTIMQTYTLTIADTGATLSIVGFQADDTLYADVRPASNRVDIAFRSYENGSAVNKYGVAQYHPGDVLFSLVRSGKRLETTWGKLKPDDALRSKGVYFSKSK